MDWRLWSSSFVFVLVTVLKLLFPEQTEDLRKQTVALIDMDMDYRVWVTEVGSYLTEQKVYEVSELLELDAEDIPLSVTAEPVTVVLPKTSEVKGIEERVQDFLAAQEAYASYEIPANVSYDQIKIPFSYAAPVEGVCSSGFGYRVHPLDDEVAFHYGTDYEVVEGTSICSFADGVVAAVGEEAGYGNYICIDHEGGWRTLYAHCSAVNVVSGQQVSMGEMIGESGQTGRVTGPHLHFELQCNGLYTNPEFFLA